MAKYYFMSIKIITKTFSNNMITKNTQHKLVEISYLKNLNKVKVKINFLHLGKIKVFKIKN